MVEKAWEMFESSLVEHSLGLVISASHYVTNSSQGCCLHLHLSEEEDMFEYNNVRIVTILPV